MNKWNLEDPQQAEAALEFFFSLPDDEYNSDQEQDEGACEELNDLDKGSSRSSGVMDSEYETHANLVEINEIDNVDQLNLNNDDSPKDDSSISVEEVIDEQWDQNTDKFDNFDYHIFEKEKASAKNCGQSNNKEIDYFLQIFDNDIIQLIVDQTNLYASQYQDRRSNQKEGPGPSKNWSDTTPAEIKALLGVMIIMGVHRLPHLSNYWSSDPYLYVSSVAQTMTSKRYKKLIENLHLNDNTTAVEKNEVGYDKLHKVRPLMDRLRIKILSCYNHSSCLAVDESMIPFKGRSNIKQYMPKKPTKWGYKAWCLADSETGYICNFDIYTGKSENHQTHQGLLGERIVLQLTTNIDNKGCLVAFDNFFTTVELMKSLLRKNIYSVGTVRGNRKGLPKFMKDKKTPLKRGEFMFQVKSDVAAVKWMDNNPVSMLSTCFSPRDTTYVQRKDKSGKKVAVSCPRAISYYNQIMGGVDRFDQLREVYEVGRKSTKWWHRIFYYFLDLAIVNAHILMNTDRRRIQDQLSFRINLSRQLIGGFTSRKSRNKPVNFLANKRVVPEEIRLVAVGKHLPKKNTTYRRCRLCSSKIQEKRTRFICLQCNVPLCIDPCFTKFHGK